jgi:hypothetical protein
MKITKVEMVNGEMVDVAPNEAELEVGVLFDKADLLFRQGKGKDAAAVMAIMIDRFVNLPKEEK